MTNLARKKQKRSGYALMIVLVFATLALVSLGGALSWTSSNASTTERNNRYFTALAAAEAASEKILARISRDYQNYGEGVVYSSLSTYRDMVPTTSESSYWTNYAFSDAAGNANKTHVSRLTAWGYTNLSSQYAGLKGMASTYRIISNAKSSTVGRPMTAALKQEIQVAAIPIFQFAIFYSMDLEINPGPVMNITGRVHSNSTLYTEPVASVTYMDHVTAAGDIILKKSPLDPTSRSVGTVNFKGEHDARVTSLNLPIGTNNTPAAVRAVVEIPPAGESTTSLMGKQRYYNKADLVLIVSNTTVTAKSGSFNNFVTAIPAAQYNAFLNTNISFYNKREGKTVKAVQLDVGKLALWSQTNTTLKSVLGRDVSAIYVADKRDQTASTEPGIRLVNGQTLPNLGLTVATPNPLYVQGHYNAPASALGTANTALTKPASLVGDSITVLSTAWNDANSTKSLSYRAAANTTVNAAFLGGIVASDGANYSGGVENFPRFLEDWSGDTFTYNGSMVVMYYSQIATAPWGGSDVYNPPSRNWAFDINFMDATKLPPGTPQLLTTIRGKWEVLPPDTIL